MFRFYLANLQQGALGIVCFFAKIICVLATTWFIFCFLLFGFHPVPLIIALACLVYVLWFSYYQSKRSYEWQVSMRQDAYQRGMDGGYGQMPQGYPQGAQQYGQIPQGYPQGQPQQQQFYGGAPTPYIPQNDPGYRQPPARPRYHQYGQQPPQGQNPHQQ